LLLNGYCFIILFTASSSLPLKYFPNHANAENAFQDLKAEVLFIVLFHDKATVCVTAVRTLSVRLTTPNVNEDSPHWWVFFTASRMYRAAVLRY